MELKGSTGVFSKKCEWLDPGTAFLAALIKKPEHYLRISELKTGRKFFSLEELKDVNQRQQSILRRLELEWIDDQTFQRASDENFMFLFPIPKPVQDYFVQHVINLLRTEHGLGQVYGGMADLDHFHPSFNNFLKRWFNRILLRMLLLTASRRSCHGSQQWGSSGIKRRTKL